LSIDQENVEVHFDAQLTVASGYVFQYQLSAPAKMRVLELSVHKEGGVQSARWSQAKDGMITVFMAGPADGEQQLSLHGLMPLESGEKTPLPGVGLQQCKVQSTTVQVFRRPSVQLELTVPSAAMKSIANQSSETDLSERGRVVHAFRLDGNDPVQGEVRLAPNNPQINAKQVTRLRQEERQWIAEAEFQLDVNQGVADQFWIDVPDCWKEPFTVDPPAKVKIVEIPGETRRLLVQPRYAISGAYKFSIGGSLEIKPGEAPAAPNIILRKTRQYSRWLVLPRKLKDQTIGWEIHGLRPADLTDSAADPSEKENNFIYEIVNQTPRAVLQSQALLPGTARVSLADIRLAWQADGMCRAVATFDLEPGGQPFCPLQLPDGYELVYVTVDGLPITPLSLGQGRWQLPLVSDRLPQRVVVVFRGTLSEPLYGGSRNFAAPWLGDLPVIETLWTVRSPSVLMPVAKDEGKTVPLYRQQWLRFRNAAEMIAGAIELLRLDDTEETSRWYQLRARYMTTARSSLQNELALVPVSESTQALEREIETLDQQQTECAQGIGLTNVLTQVKKEPLVTGDPADNWEEGLDESANIVRYAIEDPSPSITVDYQPMEQIGMGRRFMAVFLLMGVVVLIVIGMRRGTWKNLFENRPYAVGIAVGLAWWCWLWPSFLGIVMVLVCLIAWWRSYRKVATEIRPAEVTS
ncbi:MAG TPA: hypothetical protein VIH42_05570, partial [Thermoguttaceae bacterium]